MIYFTICAKNYLGYAFSLYESLRANQGPIVFYVAICDDIAELDCLSFPFHTISVDQLEMQQWEHMKSAYNITELNTSIKPFVFDYLFEHHPGSQVVYLDPDILVMSKMEELEAAFVNGFDCVLTPHLLEPAEFSEMHDQRILLFGCYNLGFCALRDTPNVRRIVHWWGRRLEHQCVIDLANGLFVDQRWVDLFPSYIARTLILRHPGYNVAYWNLAERRVSLEGKRWLVNRQPLRFMHFSGNSIEDRMLLSRHSSQFTRQNCGDVAMILHLYGESLHRNGYAHYKSLKYAYRWDGPRGQNLHTPSGEGLKPATQGVNLPHLPLLRSSSFVEYREARAASEQQIQGRRGYEVSLIPCATETFVVPGFCVVCGTYSHFQVSSMYSASSLPDGRPIPNWREHLNCKHCGLVNRMRASLHVLLQEFAPNREANIYLTEQMTPAYALLKQRFPNLQGSEYFGHGHSPGSDVDGYRHEDLEELSFDDESLDYVLSFDVLEHVVDEKSALMEIVRCLRKDGVLLFTVPFRADQYECEVRAQLDENGQLIHLLPPEVHGNPVDPKGGALCFRYFAWSVLSTLREIGFQNSEVFSYWSREFAYLGDPQFVIVARKLSK